MRVDPLSHSQIEPILNANKPIRYWSIERHQRLGGAQLMRGIRHFGLVVSHLSYSPCPKAPRTPITLHSVRSRLLPSTMHADPKSLAVVSPDTRPCLLGERRPKDRTSQVIDK